MNGFQKIEKILIDKQIGITDFLEITGVGRSSYYALKKGETENVVLLIKR